jgi:flagellar basal-body rod protein FlgC
MDFFSSMRISASGLNAQQTRMNTISSNLANAESVGYKRKDPVFQANADRKNFAEILDNKIDEHAQGVLVTEIKEDTKPPRLQYNPSHPQARPDGYVEMPNINPVEEYANMINASRSYEANITAMNAAKSMALKALDIGK